MWIKTFWSLPVDLLHYVYQIELFAELLHKKVEEKYPGLSRGITIKSNENKETYNQDSIDKSVLLNIRGV